MNWKIKQLKKLPQEIKPTVKKWNLRECFLVNEIYVHIPSAYTDEDIIYYINRWLKTGKTSWGLGQ